MQPWAIDVYKRQQDIIDAATNDANNLRLSAISYTDEMMANICLLYTS